MITIKTPEDIAILREGGKIIADIHRSLVGMVAPGVTTQELDDEAAKLMKAAGATSATLGHKAKFAPRAFPGHICVSVNEELVHGIPNEKPRTLKEGDTVKIDVTIIYKKMVVDAAQTVIVGKGTEEDKKLIEVTKGALMRGIGEVHEGARVGDIGAAIEKYVKPFGYGIVDVLCGHGVGYKIHEEPMIPNFGKKGTGAKLKAGMVLAIEPMVNAGSKEVDFDEEDGYTVRTRDGKQCAHFEHTVLVTEKGYEILSQGVGEK